MKSHAAMHTILTGQPVLYCTPLISPGAHGLLISRCHGHPI